MKDLEKTIESVDYGALAKKIAGKELTEEEKKGAQLAKQLGDEARKVKNL